MKKIVIPFLLIAAILTCVRIGFALTGSVVVPGEKQLLVDGDMESSGTTAWPEVTDVTVTKNETSPHGGVRNVRLTYSSGGVAYVGQSILTTGKTYTVTGWSRGDGTNQPHLGLNGSFVVIGTPANTWQQFNYTFTTNRELFAIGCQTLGVGGYVEFDDVTVTEYKGYVQNQDTQKLVDGDMETATTAAWPGSGAVILSKQTGAPHGGLRVLRIASDGESTGGYAYQYCDLSVGKIYHVTGWARSVNGVSTMSITTTDGSGMFWAGTNSTSWQRIDYKAAAASTGIILWALGIEGDGGVEFDDLMITEYKGEIKNIEKQVLADGDMEAAGTTAWTADSATLSKQTGTPHGGTRVLRILAAGGGNPYASQSGLVSGKRYRVRGYVRSDGTASPSVDQDPWVRLWLGTTSTNWQFFDFEFTCTGTGLRFYGSNSEAEGLYSEFDDVFVTLAQ